MSTSKIVQNDHLHKIIEFCNQINIKIKNLEEDCKNQSILIKFALYRKLDEVIGKLYKEVEKSLKNKELELAQELINNPPKTTCIIEGYNIVPYNKVLKQRMSEKFFNDTIKFFINEYPDKRSYIMDFYTYLTNRKENKTKTKMTIRKRKVVKENKSMLDILNDHNSQLKRQNSDALITMKNSPKNVVNNGPNNKKINYRNKDIQNPDVAIRGKDINDI